jgi:hypothetical protein
MRPRHGAGEGRPPGGGVDCRVEWSPEFQYCTAAAHDGSGKLVIALTCGRPDPCHDPIVRLRIEQAAHQSLLLLLAALRP